jgi:ppGpp synthetase/RelA/SpoT-type nucleotidyltranferase
MKIDTVSIIKQYDANLKKYEKLEELVHYTLSKAIKKQGIKIHSIIHRIKEISSLLDKARRKKIEDPFGHMHDLVGFRVVCLFLPDLEEIEKIIHKEFEVFEKDDKINDTELNIFGYMSLHLKAYIKHPSTVIDEIQKIPFEIQVRTIAQDAWASISHYLDYKKESVIPDQLKRDFHALSGLFYVADTHFSLLKQEQTKIFFDKSINTKSPTITFS